MADFQLNYDGPEINRRLALMAKYTRGGLPVVVASKRIPLINWGECPIRFSKVPVFIVKKENVIGIDFENNAFFVYSPVLRALLGQIGLNSNQTYQISAMSADIREGVVKFDCNLTQHIDDALENRGYFPIKFVYEEGQKVNAIRKNNDGTFSLIWIDSAFCVSPHIQIQGGNIVGCKMPGIYLGPGKNWNADMDGAYYFKYRKTGHYRRVNHQKVVKTKNWNWMHEKKGQKLPRKMRTTANIDLFEINGYFNRNNRQLIWVRAYPLCYKRRFVSSVYKEIRKTLLHSAI